MKSHSKIALPIVLAVFASLAPAASIHWTLVNIQLINNRWLKRDRFVRYEFDHRLTNIVRYNDYFRDRSSRVSLHQLKQLPDLVPSPLWWREQYG